jgi:hypothetical protein
MRSKLTNRGDLIRMLLVRGLVILAVVVVVLQCCDLPRRTDGRCVLFNFGDSNSDTGSLPAAYGFYLGPPAGRRFFHRTTGRWSDGRLYIDFIGTYLQSKSSLVPCISRAQLRRAVHRLFVQLRASGSGT